MTTAEELDTTVAAALAELGVEVPDPAERTPAAAASFVASETAKWEALVRDARITAE